MKEEEAHVLGSTVGKEGGLREKEGLRTERRGRGSGAELILTNHGKGKITASMTFQDLSRFNEGSEERNQSRREQSTGVKPGIKKTYSRKLEKRIQQGRGKESALLHMKMIRVNRMAKNSGKRGERSA